jgi:hypothetical protein|tara:strand:+ start:3158 stop:5359 length:2202 start_codon:yes stop_codon:yes gene_type:complete
VSTSGTKVPSIVAVPSKVDPQLKRTLDSLIEVVQVLSGRRGDPRDRAVTLRELVAGGLAEELLDNPFNPNAGTGVVDFGPPPALNDVTTPPVPTGLAASAAFTTTVVSWDDPQFGNFAFTEVYRGTSNNISNSVLADTTTASVWSDSNDYNQTFFYWIRHVSTSNIKGPFAGPESATTAADIAAVMTSLGDTLADLPGYNLLATNTTAAVIIKSSSQPSTRGDGSSLQPNDIWFDTDDGQIYIRNTANNAWVAGRDSSLVTLFGSTSFTGSTLTGAMATAQSDIVTVTNAQSATATSLTNLTSTVGTNSSSISTLNTTTATHTGDLDAMFVLQVSTESNGSKSAAGMVIGSNASDGSGAQSFVQFQADRFVIFNGASSNTSPFEVSSNTVFIKNAMIQDAAITTAKIGSLAVDEARIASAAVTNAKLGNASVSTAKIQDASITDAKIVNAAVTNAKIANAAIDTAKVGSLFANTLNGDVAKAEAASLGSSVTFVNNSNTFSTVLTLELAKPTHSQGWVPYGNFNLNQVSVEKNSWYHIVLEMAPWNVNSQGGTATETASTSSTPSAFGSGYDGSAIVSTYLSGLTSTGANNTVTFSTSIASLANVAVGDIITDGSTDRTINGNTVVFGSRLISYSGSNVSAWGSSTTFSFKSSISAGAVGAFVEVAKILWVAVDTAYNDFAISGVFAGATEQQVTHGVKARARISGDANILGSSNASGNQTVFDATGFLMGVR